MSGKKRRQLHRPSNPPESPQGVQVRQASWEGPLPPPAALRSYDEVCPGAADRILSMAEGQLRHRIDIERQVISGQIRQGGRGQIFGLIIGLAAVGGGVTCVLMGHDVAGGAIAGSGAIGLVSAFVYGKKSQQKELKEKRPE